MEEAGQKSGQRAYVDSDEPEALRIALHALTHERSVPQIAKEGPRASGPSLWLAIAGSVV